MRQQYSWLMAAASIFLVESSSMLAFGQDTTAHNHTQGNFPPPIKPPQIRAREVLPSAITLDGVLQEPSWVQAEATTNFFQTEPVQGSPNRHSTTVRVLFDERFLYIGVVCRDSAGRGGVRVQDLRRDFDFDENDIFAVQLDPQNLKRYCVSFQTTPYGSQRDLQVFDDNFRDNDWDALWQVRTEISDSGWTAEFAIPFATLRYDFSEQQDTIAWGVSFFRLARRDAP
jgi:Carbohydrate family 9 binding domain-like